jgi:hypothetical protein
MGGCSPADATARLVKIGRNRLRGIVHMYVTGPARVVQPVKSEPSLYFFDLSFQREAEHLVDKSRNLNSIKILFMNFN